MLNLTIDGPYADAEVREVTPPSDDGFKTPCSISGLMAGVSGGSLGYAFGFAGHWLNMRLKGSLGAAHIAGWGSAKTFAIMGGLYAAVSCFMLRLRQRQDAWNGAVSGCATGLALGWAGGPLSALQSCAMLGGFSYFVDGMAGGDAQAHAASVKPGDSTWPATSGSSRDNVVAFWGAGDEAAGRRRDRSRVEMLLTPAMPLLAALAPCRGEQPGCRRLF